MQQQLLLLLLFIYTTIYTLQNKNNFKDYARKVALSQGHAWELKGPFKYII